MKKLILALLCFASPALAQAPQSFPTYINGLTPATQANPTDLMYLLQGGLSRSIQLGFQASVNFVQPPANSIGISGVGAAPTLANSPTGALFVTAASGVTLQGKGATNDLVLRNAVGGAVLFIPTTTTQVNIPQGPLTLGNNAGSGAQLTMFGSASGNTIITANSTGLLNIDRKSVV